MELSSKLLQQLAFNKRLKLKEYMLNIMDKSAHKEKLSQPRQTNKKQYKIAVTFLTCYNGTFNVRNKKILYGNLNIC